MHHARWEYKVEDLKGGFLFKALEPANLTDTLNREGMQGWELINVISIAGTMKAFFKRAR